jgi:hypothetical protein
MGHLFLYIVRHVFVGVYLSYIVMQGLAALRLMTPNDDEYN